MGGFLNYIPISRKRKTKKKITILMSFLPRHEALLLSMVFSDRIRDSNLVLTWTPCTMSLLRAQATLHKVCCQVMGWQDV